jgi:hypothetical protein
MVDECKRLEPNPDGYYPNPDFNLPTPSLAVYAGPLITEELDLYERCII